MPDKSKERAKTRLSIRGGDARGQCAGPRIEGADYA